MGALSNVDVDEEVSYLSKMLLNVNYNFIPHDAVVCDDRDPLWLNKEIKNLMVEKNKAYKSYLRVNKSTFLFEKFRALQNQLNTSGEDFKERYYSKLSSMFADPLTSLKTYWSISKTSS